ncbi:MATE family efflux transporter [Dyadobacter sp. CY343]|uniref:MATE family efflux transporter n=1 Tax=Dyadobacter sp. CY343 TaxID=2907299 RepID=UPI001EFF36F6|nr:MATE family efflux transporter [Dyadobacter sp. CY343]MCE7060885.1 polysaccharide biosynthesis C-terminal domain-containing protein [Dyadobacter sp. CY343]
MKDQNPLAEAPVKPLFFKYYAPALISILSVTAHQVINGIILGRQVGKEGLAAVGLYGSVLLVFIALTLPIMVGGGIMISKNIGAADYPKVGKIFRFATTLGLLFGAIIALSAPFVVRPIADFLAGAENEQIAQSTSDYMLWQLVGLPFFFIRMFWSNFVSNDGNPKTARNASLLAVFVNIVLDLLLIVVFSFGVTGASIATTLAIFSGTLFLFFHIRKGKGYVNFRRFRFTLQLQEWRELLRLGVPSFASEIAFSTGLLIINRRVVAHGALAVAAFGMINYISFIFLRFFTAAMIACLPIISFNLGAQKLSRAREVFLFALLFTFLLGIAVAAAGFAFPQPLVTLFSGKETKEFGEIATNGIGWYFTLFLAAGPNYVLSAYLQSTGQTTVSIIMNVLKGGLLVALFAWILPYFLGLNGVWLARGVAEIVSLLLIGGYCLSTGKGFVKPAEIS